MSVSLLMHRVIIIESLPEGHKRTGFELEDYLDTQLRSEIAHEIEIAFKKVANKESLFALLSEIKIQLRKEKEVAVLHLETHGGVHGLELSNGEQVRWSELRPIFTEINQITKCNLLLVFAMCNGANYLSELTKIAEHRCPCAAMLGAIDEIYPEKLLRALKVFYKTLLETHEFEASVMTMNISTQSDLFIPLNAYTIYKEMQARFMKDMHDPKKLDEWASQMSASTHLSKRNMKKAMKKDFANKNSGFWSKTRDKFLMFDRFPENKARFLS